MRQVQAAKAARTSMRSKPYEYSNVAGLRAMSIAVWLAIMARQWKNI